MKASGQVLALATLPSRKERRLGGLQTSLKKRKILLTFKIFYFLPYLKPQESKYIRFPGYRCVALRKFLHVFV